LTHRRGHQRTEEGNRRTHEGISALMLSAGFTVLKLRNVDVEDWWRREMREREARERERQQVMGHPTLDVPAQWAMLGV